jgi:hypothetical protein
VNPHEEIAEERIQAAMAAGQFDGRPGAGEPPDLGRYFETPSAWRVGLSVFRGAGMVPEELEMLRQLNQLARRLEGEPSAAPSAGRPRNGRLSMNSA